MGGSVPLASDRRAVFGLIPIVNRAPVLRYPLLGDRLEKADARPCIVVAAPMENSGLREKLSLFFQNKQE
jgi:hypothetical protein